MIVNRLCAVLSETTVREILLNLYFYKRICCFADEVVHVINLWSLIIQICCGEFKGFLAVLLNKSF